MVRGRRRGGGKEALGRRMEEEEEVVRKTIERVMNENPPFRGYDDMSLARARVYAKGDFTCEIG